MEKEERGCGTGNRYHVMGMTVAGKVWRVQPRRRPDREGVLVKVVMMVGSGNGDAVVGSLASGEGTRRRL